MTVHTSNFAVASTGFSDVHDITAEVANAVSASRLHAGVATVFVPGSTAGVTTIEFESGAVADFRAAIERLAPRDLHYAHDARWGDGNGFSHVRAAMLGPSMGVPFSGGELLLGTWQQIVLVDFDNRPRKRDIIVQVMGE